MIVAGTGHRPDKLGGYSDDVTNALVHTACDALERLQPETVISGCALGWDQALIAAALHLGIPIMAAVPFTGFDAKWPSQSRARLADLLSRCATVRTVCEPGYAAWKLQKRNEWMVDHCDIVLACWNGTAGGTANCVGYAKGLGRPVKNAWRLYQHVRTCEIVSASPGF
jgi:uncharacterized phage-like protein YoqJ